MVKKVISVKRLQKMFEEKSKDRVKNLFDKKKELLAYPVKAASIKGFYMGIMPVYKEGYGLNHTFSGLYFRADGVQDFPAKTVEHSHVFFEDDYFLEFDDHYYLNPVRVTSKLIKFGFSSEQIEQAKEEVVFPFFDSELTFSHEEIGILYEKLGPFKEKYPEIFKKIERSYEQKTTFMNLKFKLEKPE